MKFKACFYESLNFLKSEKYPNQKIRAPKMILDFSKIAKMAFLNLLQILQNWFHVKYYKQQNPKTSTLCDTNLVGHKYAAIIEGTYEVVLSQHFLKVSWLYGLYVRLSKIEVIFYQHD